MIDLMEATVAQIHAAFANGTLTCADVVDYYLERIEAFDKQGPAINAIIAVNPNARARAAELDALYAADPSSAGPLHGIPVILKDNYDTADMPTTGASVSFARSQPLQDATMVARLRAAGAIIIAKANLMELARGGITVSSLGGQSKNPYDLTRTPGGSSGGTGVAIAANFAVLGTGSDTGQSTRSPASAQNCVGVRPTRGLLSRGGIMPNSKTQDEGGPIARTVEDAARFMDVCAGYDPRDPITAFSIDKKPASYLPFLDAEGLKGARLGLLTDFVGHDEIHAEVNAALDKAIAAFEGAGATVVPVTIPDLEAMTTDIATSRFENPDVFDTYLKGVQPGTAPATFADFVALGEFHPAIASSVVGDGTPNEGEDSYEYYKRHYRRHLLRQAIMTVLADNQLDALLYPHQKRLVAFIGDEQLERNGVLSNATGLPAITFPGGFSSPTDTAPIGVPVGIELLGPDYSEPRLFRLAYAFEQATHFRRAPLSVQSVSVA